MVIHFNNLNSFKTFVLWNFGTRVGACVQTIIVDSVNIDPVYNSDINTSMFIFQIRNNLERRKNTVSYCVSCYLISSICLVWLYLVFSHLILSCLSYVSRYGHTFQYLDRVFFLSIFFLYRRNYWPVVISKCQFPWIGITLKYIIYCSVQCVMC